MNTIAVMPGRYNPPHSGHKVVYDKLVKKFGAKNAFIVTSDKQEAGKSPFPFKEKKALWKILGVPESQIIQVRNPYSPKELTDNLDGDGTAIVFALGRKDADRFSFQPKKDGSPSYMQQFTNKDLKPLSQSGYVLILPTVSFSIAGKTISGATEIRTMYANANEKQRKQIVSDLYGTTAFPIGKLFDKRLARTVTEDLLREYVDFINTV